MVSQFKARKILGLKEHLQKKLHLPPSKSTSGTRTQDLSDSRSVFLPLNQVFGIARRLAFV
jgi:hypothetical protein